MDSNIIESSIVKETSDTLKDKENLSNYFTRRYLENPDFVNQIEKAVTEEPAIKEIKEMLALLKDLSPNKETVTTDGKPVETEVTYNFDWNIIYDLSSKIIEEYSQQIDSIFKELEIVNKILGYWQEAGFSYDAHLGLKVMNNHEQWTENKRKYLKYRQGQLDSTVKEIADSVGRLERD
ncbi:hypothetical protein C6P45_001373 [Maudiozyma exigua]|uniref:Uncharacterized protein n=1 Tax=Maudiozyma exigua TaxID=34358 RepID=A0A9P7B6R8_MAUEX|nr:hypothetical protein C6P45_001373 [Kazachstania exigua]